MNDEKELCDLCSLPIEIKGFELKTKEGHKAFCCEGCKGIFLMLNEDDILEDSDEKSTVTE